MQPRLSVSIINTEKKWKKSCAGKGSNLESLVCKVCQFLKLFSDWFHLIGILFQDPVSMIFWTITCHRNPKFFKKWVRDRPVELLIIFALFATLFAVCVTMSKSLEKPPHPNQIKHSSFVELYLKAHPQTLKAKDTADAQALWNEVKTDPAPLKQ